MRACGRECLQPTVWCPLCPALPSQLQECHSIDLGKLKNLCWGRWGKYRKLGDCWSNCWYFPGRMTSVVLFAFNCHLCCAVVTKRCGIWLFVTQRPINRTDWWKGKFASFQMLAAVGGSVDIYSKADSSWLAASGARAFIVRRKGLHAKTARSVPAFPGKLCSSVSLCHHNFVPFSGGLCSGTFCHLQIGHWWSDQHHLGCFRHS